MVQDSPLYSLTLAERKVLTQIFDAFKARCETVKQESELMDKLSDANSILVTKDTEVVSNVVQLRKAA